jgi:uncharacterized alpha-E superfamily protein
MISRVAQRCFWLGRYLERAENTTRMLAVTQRLSPDAGLDARQCWYPVVVVSGEEAAFTERFGVPDLADGEKVQRYLTWGEESACSIRSAVAAVRENARSAREVVSQETWGAVNELHLWMVSPEARALYRDDRHAFYRHIRQNCTMALGYIQDTMLHEDPFDFILLGVMLERAGQTARILDVNHHAFTHLPTHQVIETAHWLSLLRSCSGFEPFMKRCRGPITSQAVAAFLVLEPDFPRSVRYAIGKGLSRLKQIRHPAAFGQPGAASEERLQELEQWVSRQRAEALQPGAIHGLLTYVVEEIAAICNDVARELLGEAPAAYAAASQ